MPFHDFPVYKIPDTQNLQKIQARSDVLIVVKEVDFGEAQEQLLAKILKAAQRDMDSIQLIKVAANTTIQLMENEKTDNLVVSFGIPSERMCLQLDHSPYSLIHIRNRTFLFSHSLTVLPEKENYRRALWHALKRALQHMKTFILATHNQHKVIEMSKIMEGLDISLSTLFNHNIHDEIIEDGTSMHENAWIKANYIRDLMGGNVIADDSGLEVDALDGAPGIYSARYAGPQKNSDDNIDKLLHSLDAHNERSAQFRAVLAVWVDDQQFSFEGIIRGTIARKRIGSEGFGYDPIFIPDGYETSFGVLDACIKNEISHRADAVRQFKQFIASF